MRNARPFSRPSPAPSDMLNRSSTIARNRSASCPVRHHHRRHDRAVLVVALAQNLEAPGADGRARRLGQPPMPREHAAAALPRRACAALRAGRTAGSSPACRKESVRVGARASRPTPSRRAAAAPCFDAASALALIALKLRPGGSIRPFCDPASVTSRPHSSCRRSIDPSDDTASTSSSAGCRARSIARRISGSRLVTPVEVSLWTTSSALIR